MNNPDPIQTPLSTGGKLKRELDSLVESLQHTNVSLDNLKESIKLGRFDNIDGSTSSIERPIPEKDNRDYSDKVYELFGQAVTHIDELNQRITDIEHLIRSIL